MKCLDDMLARVLMDTGSSLNVMPKSTLSKLSCKKTMMRSSVMVVKAFDGSRRTVVGEVGPTLTNRPKCLSNKLSGYGYQSNLQLPIGKIVNPCCWCSHIHPSSENEVRDQGKVDHNI